MTSTLYTEIHPLLVTAAQVIAGRRYRQIGEDLIQAGALALVMAAEFDPARAKLKTWVDAFARGAMKDEAARSLVGPKPTKVRQCRRRGLRYPVVERAVIAEDVPWREHKEFADIDTAEEVAFVLGQCKPRERDAIERHCLRGEQLGQIGAAEGLVKSSVFRRIQAGFDRIRWQALAG